MSDSDLRAALLEAAEGASVALENLRNAADAQSEALRALGDLLFVLQAELEAQEDPYLATEEQVEEITSLMVEKGYGMMDLKTAYFELFGDSPPGAVEALLQEEAEALINVLKTWPYRGPEQRPLTSAQLQEIQSYPPEVVLAVHQWIWEEWGVYTSENLTESQAHGVLRELAMGTFEQDDGDEDDGPLPPQTLTFRLDDMPTTYPNALPVRLQTGEIDVTSGVWKMSLHSNLLVYDGDTMSDWTDLGNEVTGNNYTSGGETVNLTVTQDNVANTVKVAMDPVTFAGVTLSQEVKWAVLYRESPAPQQVLRVFEFTEADLIQGVDLNFTYPEDGLVLEFSTDDSGGTPNASWDPPENSFDPEHYVKPTTTTVTVSNKQLRNTVVNGEVVELVDDPASGEWPVWMDCYGARHSNVHVMGNGIFPTEGNPTPAGMAHFSKLRANGDWGDVGAIHFWDVPFLNEPDSQHTFDMGDNDPEDLGPDEDWSNSPRAIPHAGLFAFHDCYHGVTSDNTSYVGYGVKMHLHPQAPHDLLVEGGVWLPNREHHTYPEWLRRYHIRNLTWADTGGNSFQVASRGGHVVEPNYQHGNRLNTPAGINGWGVIEDVVINELWHPYRDASDLTSVGFMGPQVWRNITINNTISAVAVYSDTFKGAWIANGEDVPWDQPILWRSEVEGQQGPAPQGYYTHHSLWIDNITATFDDSPPGVRGMMLISGVKEVHINRFELDPDNSFKSIVFNNEFGGPFHIPLTFDHIKFYDPDSVQRHMGKIGYYNPTGGTGQGGFEAFTEEQLSDLTVWPS